MSVNLQGLKFVRGETRYARILRNAHAMHAYRCSIINVKTATARLSALISTQRDGRINETSARPCAAHHRACKKLYACWRGISRVWFSYESNCNEMKCATQLVNFSPFHTCLFNDSISKFVNFKFDHIYYLFSYICTFIRYFFLSFLAKTKQPHHVNDHRVAPGNNLGKHKHANRRSETFDAWYMRARGQLYVSMRCPEGPKGLNRGLLASTLPRVPTSLPLDLTYTFSTPLPPSSFYPVARYTWGNMAACLLTWAKQWRIHAGPRPVVCPLVFRWSRGPTT